MQTNAQPGSNQFYSTALGPYGGPSDWEHFGDEGTGTPDASSPPPEESTPVAPAQKPSVVPAQSSIVPHEQASRRNENATNRPRHDSDESSTLTQGVRRTDTIDGVIDSWTAPLKFAPRSAFAADDRPRSQDSNHEPIKEKVVEVVKEVVKTVDPYEDLEPEFRASLKRYAEMLRRESAADTDEEKFAHFEAFIKKELRLRAMLYGMDSPLQLIKTQEKATPPVGVPKTAPVDVNIAPPPVPLPSPAVLVDDSKKQLEPPVQRNETLPLQSQGMSKAETIVTAPVKQNSPSDKPTMQTPVIGPSMRGMASQLQDSPMRDSPAKDDSFVMVGADDSEAYSPGGRPLPKAVAEETYSPGGRPVVKTTKPATNTQRVPEISIPAIPQTKANITSPGVNAPMVLEDYVMPGLPSPGANAPMLVEPPSPPSASANAPIPVEGSSNRGDLSKRSSNASSLKFEPQRPVYTPFRYNPTVEAPLMPPDLSYSSLRKDGAESGRLLKHETTPTAGLGTPASASKAPTSLQPVNRMQDEAFIGLIRQQSMAVRKNKPNLDAAPPVPSLRPGTPAKPSTAAIPAALNARTPTPAASLRPGTPAAPNSVESAVVALRASLPDAVPDDYGLSANEKISSIKSQLDSIQDQFAFIHQSVVEWDQRNRKVRKQLDDERNLRQANSEARIDDMFNDNEIGYADIGDLEAEFKLGEARLKYDEDKDELDSFTQDVYESVTGRLQSELAELNTLYTTAIDLLDLESEPASRCLKTPSHQTSNTPEMGLAMSLVLSAFNKIELRQQKIAEAKVERERRRKRLELTVLYTNGDTAGVKTLEAEFAVAEKMQVLHEARARDTRANKLMDHFDRATVRGLGDNQTLVDELLPKVRVVRDMVLKDPSIIGKGPEGQNNDLLYGAHGVHATLTLTQSVIDLLLLDSQKLLTISNVADKLLNDADYSVSVAEARVSNADASVYAKLKEEKEKEDQKIVEDTQGRMGAVGKGPGEVAELCREVRKRVGEDEGHGSRVGRALVEARRRNEGVGGGGVGGMEGVKEV